MWAILCVWLGWMINLLQVKLGQELIISPRRVGLAQASLEKARPNLFSRKVAQATYSSVWASEPLAQARGISPKWDPACAPAPFLSPRLGEGGLAWASASRLSETL